MRITIPRQQLLDAVNKVKTVVSPKSALPILSHILFETGDSSLRLTATDLKVSVECRVDCTVDEPGSLTASCQRLASILSELPDQDITLEMGADSIIGLSCGRIQTKLYSMSPEEFPPVRSFDGIEPLTLDQKVLKKLFTKTSFAICSDQARYNLTGLLFQITAGRLTVVSTDGRRMSLCIQSDAIPQGIDIRVIIPSKMVGELEHLLGDEGQVNVYLDETQAAFAFNSIRLVTALIEGNFPNYDTVIPKKHDKEAVISTLAFADAMRRTRTMTNEKFNSVRITIENGQMILKVVTPEVGEYQEEMPIEYQGESVEIAFNPAFVLDVLRRTDSEKVCLVLKDGMSPGLIKPFTDAEADTYLNVIMPIRI